MFFNVRNKQALMEDGRSEERVGDMRLTSPNGVPLISSL